MGYDVCPIKSDVVISHTHAAIAYRYLGGLLLREGMERGE